MYRKRWGGVHGDDGRKREAEAEPVVLKKMPKGGQRIRGNSSGIWRGSLDSNAPDLRGRSHIQGGNSKKTSNLWERLNKMGGSNQVDILTRRSAKKEVREPKDYSGRKESLTLKKKGGSK